MDPTDSNSNFSDDIRRYIGLVWRWAWLLLIVTALAGGATYAISRRSIPIYQASTTILINEAPANKTADYASLVTSERLAQTYSQLIVKNPVLEQVSSTIGGSVSPGSLKRMVAVALVKDTQLIDIRVQDTDPQRAALIANTLVTVFSEQNRALQASRYATSKESLFAQLQEMDNQIQAVTASLSQLPPGDGSQAERDRLEATLAQYRQTYASLLQSYEQVRVAEAQATSNVVQAEAAVPPEAPIRPKPLTNAILAGVIGLLGSLGAVLVIEALDDRLHGPDEIIRELGLPVLGLVIRHDVSEGRPVTQAEPRAPVSEAFRSLRTNIQYASVDHPVRTLLITSPSPSEGKSTIAANLGIVMAQSGHRTVVVDADLRRPRLHRLLGLSNRRGMTSLFVQPKISLNGSLQPTEAENLSVVVAGEIPPNPSELLGSDKMFAILDCIQEKADLVIVDSPPVLAVTDSAVLAPHVDGVLLVVKPGSTRLVAARQAVEQLHRVGARILGVVMNEVELRRSSYHYYHYKGYYYAYREYYQPAGSSLPVRLKHWVKHRRRAGETVEE